MSEVIDLEAMRRRKERASEPRQDTFEALEAQLVIAQRDVSFFGASFAGESPAEDTVSVVVADVSRGYSVAIGSVYMTRTQWREFRDMADKLLGESDFIVRKAEK